MSTQLLPISKWIKGRRVLVLVLIIAIVLRLLTVYFFARQNKLFEKQFAYQLEQVQLKESFENLNSSFSDAELALRNYAIMGDKKAIVYYGPAIDTVLKLRNRFHELQQPDLTPAEKTVFTKYDQWLTEDLDLLQRAKLLCDSGKLDQVRALIANNEEVSQNVEVKKASRDILTARVQRSEDIFKQVSDSDNSWAYLSFITATFLSIAVLYLLLMEIYRRKRIHTELKTREEYFHITINSIAEGLITTDKNGEILYMNAAAEKLTGWSFLEAKDLPLQKVYNVLNEDSGKDFETIVTRILKTGRTVEFENNTVLQTKDNNTRIISNSGSPLFDAKGNISGTVLVFQDITYQVEEELRIAKATIQAQESERQQLGLELHDNVNQILVGAMLNLGMTKVGSPDQIPEHVEKTRSYILRAIEEIRNLSHRLTPASFNDISLKEAFDPLIQSINVDNRFKISFHFDEIDHNNISDDIKINLYRILQEQLKNIVKYASATSIEIILTLTAGGIQMSIADNGVGFDPGKTRTGIGLSNIKKRAELFKGKFTLNTAEGKGCVITVEIPLK